MDPLRDPSYSDTYRKVLSGTLTRDFKFGQCAGSSVADLWDNLRSIIASSANSSLPKGKPALSPIRAQARRDYLLHLRRFNAHPQKPGYKANLSVAKQRLEAVNQSRVDAECKRFFDSLNLMNLNGISEHRIE